MAIIVHLGHLSLVPAKPGHPRGVALKNTELLNSLVRQPQDTLQLVRDEIGFPVYLSDVEVEDDGTMVLRSEAACKRLEVAQLAAQKAPAAAAAPAKNCICGLGC